MKIVLTGGGTAGHVTPNLAIAPLLREAGFEVHYIGMGDGMERGLATAAGIPFHAVPAGKLRRYADARNLTDVFRTAAGYWKSLAVLAKLRPQAVFSKGGFVSCPVVWAAWTLRIPVVLHESDFTPGLANRLCIPFASKICVSFPETLRHLKAGMGELTGIPIRPELLTGDAEEGARICGFKLDRPVVMVIGGSQGSQKVNEAIRASLKEITDRFDLCHICGAGNISSDLEGTAGYKQIEYASDELPHLFAMADVVIGRAGATTLFELLALRKPNLLIPLSAKVSRGDQILNAQSFERQGFSRILPEDDMTPRTLTAALGAVYEDRESLRGAMANSTIPNAAARIVEVLKSSARR